MSVIGDGLGELGRAACRFESEGAETVVPAAVIAPSIVECSTPAHSEGAAGVRIVLGGGDLAEGMRMYRFHGDVHMDRLLPSIGTSSTEQLVTVIGRHFLDGQAMCRAGSTHSMRGLWRSSTSMECRLPGQVR